MNYVDSLKKLVASTTMTVDRLLSSRDDAFNLGADRYDCLYLSVRLAHLLGRGLGNVVDGREHACDDLLVGTLCHSLNLGLDWIDASLLRVVRAKREVVVAWVAAQSWTAGQEPVKGNVEYGQHVHDGKAPGKHLGGKAGGKQSKTHQESLQGE